ncbi:MAG: carboxypeptidase regulatory-like domain-containing protein [Bryobacteraceae bacterium]|nr:carboxypeptidase regulatory-like domain-containing protein [Bryobacteraceae bacterium]
MTQQIRIISLLAFLITVSGLWAQMPLGTGAAAGNVVDQSGASISGAEVVMEQQATARRWQTKSSNEGRFSFFGIPVGKYRMTVTYPGFNTTTSSVEVAAGVTLELQQTLAAAMISEQVSVSGNLQALQTSRATQTTTLSSQQLVSLPTASRNYTHLIVAEAGVSAPLPDRTGRGLNLATTPGAQTEDASQSLNPSVNGARPTNNALLLNGVDTTNMLNNGGGLGSNLSLSLDAIENVELQTALYSAATGRNGGGNLQVNTKIGSNAIHGSIYHFLQNEKFNANEFFLNRAGTARPDFRRNESGFTVGGPIWRNRTFFFASAQRTQFLSGYASNAIAATGLPAGLTDDRSREALAGTLNQWLQGGAADNATFTANFLRALRAYPSDVSPRLVNTFFANPDTLQLRTITAAQIHPVSANIINARRDGKYLIPTPTAGLPSLPGSASFGRESLLQQVIPTAFNSWSGNGSIEHNFGSKNRVRLGYIKSSQVTEEAFGWSDASPSPTLGDNSSWLGSLSDIHTINPNWINELRGGFFELLNTRISKFRDITNSQLGIFNPLESAIGGLASLLPTIDIYTQRGSGGIGNAWDFFDRQRVVNIADTVSYTSGRHTLQFGGEFRRINLAGEFLARTNGDIDFENWATFLTGFSHPTSSSDLDQGDTRRNFLMKDYGLFISDDWKVGRGLTINVGLRYDFFGNPVDSEGRIGNYSPADVAARLGVPVGFQVPENSKFFQPGFNPLQVGIVLEPGVKVDLSQVNKAKYPSTFQSDFNNFAPRFGFAWQPPNFSKLVIRGGYGLFFERAAGTFKADLQTSLPFFVYQPFTTSSDLSDPYPRINFNPFRIPFDVKIDRDANGTPRWVRSDGAAFPQQSPFSTKNSTFIDPFIRTPYTQQWSLNTQYELMNGNVLDVKYVGTRGVGLLARLNLTQPLDPRTNPVNGFTDIRDSRGTLINPSFFVRPDLLGLNHNGGFRLRSNWGHSTYHAMQVNFRRRFSEGLTASVGYTWSKSIDNVSDDRGLIEHDAYSARGNRGPADFDRTHRFTAAYAYDLPGLFNKSMLGRNALGGWNLSGFITLQSGTPFSVIGNAAVNAVYAQPARVRVSFAPGSTLNNAVGTGRPQDRLDNYFNTAAFTDSLDTFGNTGRNILRGPSQSQFDFALAKTARFTERLAGEFRWEMYNAFNTPVFTNPASTFATNGPGTAGRITSTVGGPRTMQAAIRFKF